MLLELGNLVYPQWKRMPLASQTKCACVEGHLGDIVEEQEYERDDCGRAWPGWGQKWDAGLIKKLKIVLSLFLLGLQKNIGNLGTNVAFSQKIGNLPFSRLIYITFGHIPRWHPTQWYFFYSVHSYFIHNRWNSKQPKYMSPEEWVNNKLLINH